MYNLSCYGLQFIQCLQTYTALSRIKNLRSFTHSGNSQIYSCCFGNLENDTLISTKVIWKTKVTLALLSPWRKLAKYFVIKNNWKDTQAKKEFLVTFWTAFQWSIPGALTCPETWSHVKKVIYRRQLANVALY